MLDKISKTLRAYQQWWDEEKMVALKVAIMGQTGVGKSSLINALFEAELDTDPVRPGTTTVQEIHVKGKSGHDVIFYDLPGIGEDQGKDREYLEQYKDKLLEADVAIWAIHADSRAFTFDRDALNKVLGTLSNKDQQIQIMSKIIFLLTKVDQLTPTAPSHWLLYHEHEDDGVFIATKPIKDLIKHKEAYFSDVFIKPFKPLITTQTYCLGQFKVNEPKFKSEKTGSNKYIVHYDGLLENGEKERLKTQYPRYAEVFERLYENYRIISCSSRFRYKLDHVRNVIVNRLEARSALHFSGFEISGPLHTISFSKAIEYINIHPIPIENLVALQSPIQEVEN